MNRDDLAELPVAATAPPAVAARWSRSPSASDGEWALVHRCRGCPAVHGNRIAGDDNPLMRMRMAVRPLAQPPFPLEWLSRT